MNHSTKRIMFGLSLALAFSYGCSKSGNLRLDNHLSNQAEETGLSEDLKLTDQGESLLSHQALAEVGFWGGDNQGKKVGRFRHVLVDAGGLQEVLRISADNPDGQYYNGSASFQTTKAVKKGDVLLARIFFRSIQSTNESGTSNAVVFVEGPAPSYKKYLVRKVSSNSQWKHFDFPFTVEDDLAAGDLGLKVGFGLGDRAQTFDIAKVSLTNFGRKGSLADLPQTKIDYGGSDPSAAWRGEAVARIDVERKGDFTLSFSRAGRALKNAQVNVKMTRHAYHFGSVAAAHWLTEVGPDGDKYRQVLLENFNQSGTENGLKWPAWTGDWGSYFIQEKTMRALAWLKEHDFYTRGHVLVWPSKRNMPRVYELKMPDDKRQAHPSLKQDVLDHIDNVTSKTAATVDEWDVLNEPFDNHYLMDAFGKDIMIDWFKRARKNLPKQKLYINDYGILSGGGSNTVHQQHYEDTIRFLLDLGAPLDGIGLQSHFDATLTDIPRIYELIDRYHTAFPMLAIRASEFDITIEDEGVQAEYLRDFLTIFFSHPATIGVQLWGFWETAQWRPEASMYRANWEIKPNGKMWRELVYDQWWSTFDGISNDSGNFSERGFYGDYQVTVTTEAEKREFTFTLEKGADKHFKFSF